jgi:hypothetical protein
MEEESQERYYRLGMRRAFFGGRQSSLRIEDVYGESLF